ncbi:MAG: hypothetical protein HKN87_11440 [Saprospiraceae bacterium]|nr:hypothetical protein [Saprospiraceae bacterium]
MGLKSFLLRPYARKVVRDIRHNANQAIQCQMDIFAGLIRKGQGTHFGVAHRFDKIQNVSDFQALVSIRDYEDLIPYIAQIKEGKKNVLWPGIPTYFAKTSGTTSGTKYIPMTAVSTPHHVATARNSVFNYMIETGKTRFLDGKLLYLSGTPELSQTAGIPTGRLSGIVNHQVPSYLKSNKLPSYRVNCIDAWEEKVAAIVDESHQLDVRLVGGIPPWVQMYFEALLDFTGKTMIKEVFPNLSLFVYGGVNYEPYRSKLEQLMGSSIDSIETFPASEGFFAFQDKHPHQGLLLNVSAGMFYEFVPLAEVGLANPSRLTLAEVELEKQYALVVSSNAGLWAYNIGDTVEFVSLDPPRLIVSGRIKHFISAFGEHVIGKEVEMAMLQATELLDLKLVEFTVAPQVTPKEGLPHHEWLVEFAEDPADPDVVEVALDQALQAQNIYYQDLIEGSILRPAKLTLLPRHSFRRYMHSIGKLGGQNKVPRLSNDRKIAEVLRSYL